MRSYITYSYILTHYENQILKICIYTCIVHTIFCELFLYFDTLQNTTTTNIHLHLYNVYIFL